MIHIWSFNSAILDFMIVVDAENTLFFVSPNTYVRSRVYISLTGAPNETLVYYTGRHILLLSQILKTNTIFNEDVVFYFYFLIPLYTIFQIHLFYERNDWNFVYYSTVVRHIFLLPQIHCYTRNKQNARILSIVSCL